MFLLRSAAFEYTSRVLFLLSFSKLLFNWGFFSRLLMFNPSGNVTFFYSLKKCLKASRPGSVAFLIYFFRFFLIFSNSSIRAPKGKFAILSLVSSGSFSFFLTELEIGVPFIIVLSWSFLASDLDLMFSISCWVVSSLFGEVLILACFYFNLSYI